MTRAATEKSLITDDQIRAITSAIGDLDRAITPRGGADGFCPGGNDATGGYVTSLTEGVMGVTAGLCKIAEAIEKLSEAVGRLK
jgi:hypothetical protein